MARGNRGARRPKSTFAASKVGERRVTFILQQATRHSRPASPWGVALDASGNAYVTTTAIYSNSGLYKIPQTAGHGTTISSTVTANSITSIPDTGSTIVSTATPADATAKAGIWGGPVSGSGTNASGGLMAVDGTGNVWVANVGCGTIVEYSPNNSAFLSPYYGYSPSISTTAAPSNQSLFTCTVATATTCAPGNIAINASNTPLAIDRAGSVWTMDGKGTLLEVIGTAAPPTLCWPPVAPARSPSRKLWLSLAGQRIIPLPFLLAGGHRLTRPVK